MDIDHVYFPEKCNEEYSSLISNLQGNHWSRLSRRENAELNYGFLQLVTHVSESTGSIITDAEALITRRMIGNRHVAEFTKVDECPLLGALADIAILWRLERNLTDADQPTFRDDLRGARESSCAAVNAPLWIGSVYALYLGRHFCELHGVF